MCLGRSTIFYLLFALAQKHLRNIKFDFYNLNWDAIHVEGFYCVRTCNDMFGRESKRNGGGGGVCLSLSFFDRKYKCFKPFCEYF